MDLSQQELPLTAFYARDSREAKSHVVSYRTTEDSQSVARSSKRRRVNACRPTPGPLGSSAGRSKPALTTLQLPTPAASARKRMYGEHLGESPGKSQLTPVKRNAILSSGKDLTQLVFGPTSSKLPRSSCKGVGGAIPELPSTPLVIPSTDQRKTARPIDEESLFGPRLSNHTETGIATPRTSSRRAAGLAHGVDDHSPLMHSTCHLPSKSSQVSPGVCHAAPSHVQFLTRPSAALLRSPIDSGCSDLSHAREETSVFVPRDGASAPRRRCLNRSEILDDRPPDSHVMPAIPVPSSQSQYLVHPDATPKRKRCSQHVEHVISSQTQEEKELVLPLSYKPAAMGSLSTGVPLGKHTFRANVRIPRSRCSERRSQRAYTRSFTPVGSPINSSASPSRFLFATKKSSDEVSRRSSSPLRRKRSTSCHNPSCKIKTLRGSTRHDSIENIPPVHIESSQTESEFDLSILQVPRRLPDFRDECPHVRRGDTQGSLPEDGSATETESDTDIFHCVAEIGKKHACERRSEVTREDTPPLPIISPLVSPARPRTAVAPPILGFTQSSMQGDAELGAPASRTSYPPSMEPSQTCSESLPLVVRDFISMFRGDESYPPDFPESLRI